MKFIAFLRGINVGGNTIISRVELVSLCREAGFLNIQTYINSGNVIFESNQAEAELQASLEKVLLKKKEKAIPVIIRNNQELQVILSNNPFFKEDPAKVGVMLLAKPVPTSLMDGVINIGPEKIVPARREIYIYYPEGMGRSKLKFRTLEEAGTVRNINTIGKLVELSAI